DSSIPTLSDKLTLLTLHQLFTKDSPAASIQSSQAPHHSSTPTKHAVPPVPVPVQHLLPVK
ncbi:hypothetical protein CHARACLAT_016285, partial [Characodon lateralis]|nr:hypothetical protein [Characodon lateralis]